MKEFTDDLIKLFTDVEEDQPLPRSYRWVAGVILAASIVIITMVFT